MENGRQPWRPGGCWFVRLPHGSVPPPFFPAYPFPTSCPFFIPVFKIFFPLPSSPFSPYQKVSGDDPDRPKKAIRRKDPDGRGKRKILIVNQFIDRLQCLRGGFAPAEALLLSALIPGAGSYSAIAGGRQKPGSCSFTPVGRRESAGLLRSFPDDRPAVFSYNIIRPVQQEE